MTLIACQQLLGFEFIYLTETLVIELNTRVSAFSFEFKKHQTVILFKK